MCKELKEEVEKLHVSVVEIQRTLEGYKGSMEALVAFIGTMKALDNLTNGVFKAAKIFAALAILAAAYAHASQDWITKLIK